MRTFFRSVLLAACAAATLSVGLPTGVASAQTAPNVTFDRTGTFSQRGTATISGTYSCGDYSGFAYIEVSLGQTIGRVSIGGTGFAEIPTCTPGATGNWTALIIPDNGKFRGGPASAGARFFVEASGFEGFTATVHLVGHQPG